MGAGQSTRETAQAAAAAGAADGSVNAATMNEEWKKYASTGSSTIAVCSGWLGKRPANGKPGVRHQRFFVLLPSALLYYEKECRTQHEWSAALARGVIEFDQASCVRIKPHGKLTVAGVKKAKPCVVKLKARDEAEAQMWHGKLEACIEAVQRKAKAQFKLGEGSVMLSQQQVRRIYQASPTTPDTEASVVMPITPYQDSVASPLGESEADGDGLSDGVLRKAMAVALYGNAAMASSMNLTAASSILPDSARTCDDPLSVRSADERMLYGAI